MYILETNNKEVESFTANQASALVSLVGKDNAIGGLLQMLVESIERRGMYSGLSEESLATQQLLTVATLAQVLNYEQIA